MKRTLSIVTFLALSCCGIALAAQQTPSSLPATQGQDDSTPQQEQTDATHAHESVRSFEGKIIRSGNNLVLLDRAAQSSYRLDDQDKANHYKGKNVKVMATMDPNTKNLLHVVDITPSSKDR